MNTSLDNLTHKMQRAALGKIVDVALSRAEQDRKKTMCQLVDAAKQFYGSGFSDETYENAKKVLTDPNSKWTKLINCVLDQTDPHVARTTALNLGYEAFFRGTKMIRENRVKYQCNIPWLILFDPTSACNMHCVGCWAGEYGNKNNLSFEDMDKIVTQGKELGVYLYMLTGGEPLVRKNVAQLVAGLKATPGIRRVTLTTNAVLLAEQLSALLDAGLDSVNISLDTLRPEVFRQITARDDFAAVQAGIHTALESGIPVKLNCVPQVGVNEGELEALRRCHALHLRPGAAGAVCPALAGACAPFCCAGARFRRRPGGVLHRAGLAGQHRLYCSGARQILRFLQPGTADKSGLFAPLPCQRDRVRPARTAARRRGRCAAADRYPGDHLGKAPGTPF